MKRNKSRFVRRYRNVISAVCALRQFAFCDPYDPRDAKAALVIEQVQLPKFEDEPPPCHADITDLISLGFEVAETEPGQRAVRFDGELYVEGYLESLVVQGNDYLREAAASVIPINTKRQKKPN